MKPGLTASKGARAKKTPAQKGSVHNRNLGMKAILRGEMKRKKAFDITNIGPTKEESEFLEARQGSAEESARAAKVVARVRALHKKPGLRVEKKRRKVLGIF